MAPEHVEVVVAPASLDSSGSGTVTGRIWLRHARRGDPAAEFPGPNWTDFPVIILGWWLEALTALERGESRDATCAFMDGPYEFRVAAAEPTLVRVQCAQRGGADTIVADFRTSSAVLLGSVTAAAEAILTACDRRGWDGRDIAHLRRIVAASGLPGAAI